MKTSLQILAQEMATAGDQIFLPAASFRGSLPFSGYFHVGDLDFLGFRREFDGGPIVLDVICDIEGEPAEEGAMITVELLCHPNDTVGVMGGGFDTITKIALVAAAEPGSS